MGTLEQNAAGVVDEHRNNGLLRLGITPSEQSRNRAEPASRKSTSIIGVLGQQLVGRLETGRSGASEPSGTART